MRTRRVAVVLVGLLLGGWLIPLPTAAGAVVAEQAAVDRGVAQAAADGIEQSVAVVDRKTGALVASRGGSEPYISESIVKLFTVAYYQVEHGGHPDDELAGTLRYMIIHSDDRIESSLWNTDIVPSMAERYGLGHTRNGPKTGPHDWGWELITADDEATFLYKMSNDPEVAPLLMDAMANVAAVGSDGFDQHFGMNTLTGDHGSKQGWTDVGSSDQVQIHSVGWTDRYFVAILQTSTQSDYDAMRADSTRTAELIKRAEAPTSSSTSSSAGTSTPRSSTPRSSTARSSTARSSTARSSAAGPAKLDQATATAINRALRAVVAQIWAILQTW